MSKAWWTTSCATCRFGPADETGCSKCNRDARAKSWEPKEFKGFFPLMLDTKVKKKYTFWPTHIPWALLMPHESQAIANHSQTLLRLAQRGGLCPIEALAIMECRRWVQMPVERAWEIIKILTEELG